MATRLNRIQNIKDTLRRVQKGATQAYGEGREDHRQAARRAREASGKDLESTKIGQMTSSNRTMTMLREIFGVANREDIRIRKQMGMGLSDDMATRVGQVIGQLGADVTQDRTRELWWLINAPQAAANIAQEVALKRRAPDLYKSTKIPGVTEDKVARERGILDREDEPTKGYSRVPKRKGGGFQKRNYEPGFVDALSIPTGIAINSGIGLLNPLGGQEGYKAVLESEEDPNKTNNIIGEVAAKYILGRTGNLLPWDEFRKVRPDVSKDEYMAYKAFKFDNDMDLNALDGDLVAPTGVLKVTDEGIHGPEVQFLGRSLPVTTALIPAAAAIAGTAEGARYGARSGRGVRGGFLGGMGALAVGSLTGNLLEQERRRRNALDNETDTMSM